MTERDAAVSMCCLLLVSPAVVAQTRVPKEAPTLTIESLAGSYPFDAYCAPCHGRSGAGDGPVAPGAESRPG